MAITTNNVQTNINPSFASYTPPSVTDSCLVATITLEDTSNPVVTGMTFDGNAMTEAVQDFTDEGFSPDQRIAIFYLVNPGTSAGALVATGDSPINERVQWHVTTLDNVDQSTPLDSTASKPGGASSITDLNQDITTINDAAMIIAAASTNSTGVTWTSQGTQTELTDLQASSHSSTTSSQIQATAGVENQGFTMSSSNNEGVICLAAFKEAGAAPAAAAQPIVIVTT